GLGIAGAALATCLAQLASALACLVHVRAKVPVLHVVREDWRVDRASLAEHLRIGLPMGFQASIIAIGSLAVQIRINTLGPDAVAAYTTYARVDGLGVALLQSLGLAATTFAAQNVGAGKGRRIRRGIVQALGLAVGSSMMIGVVLVLAGRPLVHMFVGEGSETVIDMAVLPLHINAALYSILGVLFVLRGALQGLGQTAVPMVTGVIELVMRLGTAIVLGAVFGYAGVVWGTPLAWAGAVALLIPAYPRALFRRCGGGLGDAARLGRRPRPADPGVRPGPPPARRPARRSRRHRHDPHRHRLAHDGHRGDPHRHRPSPHRDGLPPGGDGLVPGAQRGGRRHDRPDPRRHRPQSRDRRASGRRRAPGHRPRPRSRRLPDRPRAGTI